MRILVIQGHPDENEARLCRALAAAYCEGARAAGHEVTQLDVTTLNFAILRSAAEFEYGQAPDILRFAQDEIRWCQHMVLVFPIWHGTLPALLKAFLEQVLRPGFGFQIIEKGPPRKLLSGRSARIVATMRTPPLIYRLFYGAHGIGVLDKSVLGLCGFRPVRHTLIGNIEKLGTRGVARRLESMRRLGRTAR
ncbi:NAD(P)H-dependent oxidoreductase [Consotaella aegiceratis]|uniref:NAD(P)H-dependent oxidoreductase n=1 Tax=Consotaella aegiceratis TaxID=3097961 RepID=UPI002F42BAE9